MCIKAKTIPPFLPRLEYTAHLKGLAWALDQVTSEVISLYENVRDKIGTHHWIPAPKFEEQYNRESNNRMQS